MTYKITLNERQLGLVAVALENYFRVRMGQMETLARDISSDYMDDNAPDATERRYREDVAYALLKQAYDVAHSSYHMPRAKSDVVTDIEDMWAVIRHQQWLDLPDGLRSVWSTCSDEPVIFGHEPPITVRRVDDGTTE